MTRRSDLTLLDLLTAPHAPPLLAARTALTTAPADACCLDADQPAPTNGYARADQDQLDVAGLAHARDDPPTDQPYRPHAWRPTE